MTIIVGRNRKGVGENPLNRKGCSPIYIGDEEIVYSIWKHMGKLIITKRIIYEKQHQAKRQIEDLFADLPLYGSIVDSY